MFPLLQEVVLSVDPDLVPPTAVAPLKKHEPLSEVHRKAEPESVQKELSFTALNLASAGKTVS